jgi:PST family polysaccharide transporter
MALVKRISELLHRRLVQNVMALYGVQFVNYLLPLITVPYLTRVLGTQGWGLFAFFQSFGLFAGTLVDYNFTLSATRDVSQHRQDLQQRSELLAGVLGAKVLLSAVVIFICLIAQAFVPSFKEHSLIYWMGMAWAITLAFNLFWYFQGMEKMRIAAALDLSAKGLATVAIFLFIRSEEQVWLIFLLYTLANLCSMLFAAWLAYRIVPFRVPTWRLTRGALRRGWQLFVTRFAVNLTAVGNSFILGLFVPPTLVGYFAGAEKISKAAASLCEPVTQSLFPRMSLIAPQDLDHAVRLMKRSFLFLVTFGALMSLFLFVAAPVLTSTLLGPDYQTAASILRILAALPLLIALTNVFGVQWMLALRLDRQFNIVVTTTALLNLLLAILLAPRWDAAGMAWAVLISKFAETAGIYLVLVFTGKHPFHNNPRNFKSA